ncbi:MAG: DNA/RNA non-specific endonuclease [bacterium]|nr:DNA/RNA non-specific endonuclease [bacterium]
MYRSHQNTEKQKARCAAGNCAQQIGAPRQTLIIDNRSRNPVQAVMNGAAVAQLETKISYKGTQDFTYANQTDKVGKEVDAYLDPAYPVQGTDTTGADQTALMHALPTSGGKKWVKGHLLNHDLGGRAIAWNLFPITSHANSEHYHEVEKPIKHWIGKNYHVKYNVKAIAENAADRNNANGFFACTAEAIGQRGDEPLHGKVISKAIRSLTERRDYEREYSKKPNKIARNKYSDVVYGSYNSVARDQYGTITKNKKWNHMTGSKGLNVDSVSKFKGHETLTMGNKDNSESPSLVSGDNELLNAGYYDDDAASEAVSELNYLEH